MNTTQVMHKFAAHDIVILKAHHKLRQQSKDNGEPARLAVVAVQATFDGTYVDIAYYCRQLRRPQGSWHGFLNSLGDQDFQPGQRTNAGFSPFTEAELMLYEGDE